MFSKAKLGGLGPHTCSRPNDCDSASAGPTGGAQLDKLVLRASQLGPGYKLLHRPDGDGAKGFVTLDMCDYRFTSEAARTDRLQVNYVPAGAAVMYSNEVVSYAPRRYAARAQRAEPGGEPLPPAGRSGAR